MFEQVLSTGATVGFLHDAAGRDLGYYRDDANGTYREVIFVWSEDFTEQDMWYLVQLAEKVCSSGRVKRNALGQIISGS